MFNNSLKLVLIIVCFTQISCVWDCESLVKEKSTYFDAVSDIRRSNYLYEDGFLSPESSWILGAEFYSCNYSDGYMIIQTSGGDYLYSNVPRDIWKDFKMSDSKGRFFHEHIKGRYLTKLGV